MFFFLIHIRKRDSRSWNIQLNISCTGLNQPKTILRNNRAFVSNYITKAISEIAVPLKTPWQIEASFLRIVLNYSIALFKPKSDMEACILYYNLMENTKFVSKCRPFDDLGSNLESRFMTSTLNPTSFTMQIGRTSTASMPATYWHSSLWR